MAKTSMTIGEKLQLLRKEANLSQEELAKKLSIGRSTLACYETDRNSIPNEILIAIARLFDVTTDYLLGLTEI